MEWVVGIVWNSHLVFIVTTSLDSKDNEAKEQMARASLKLIQNNLERQIINSAWWDEAIANIVDNNNMTWATNNIGHYMSEVHGMTSSFVIAIDGETTVGFIGGQITTKKAGDYIGDNIYSLIDSLFVPPTINSQTKHLKPPVTVTDFFMIENVTHMVTVCAFTPEDIPPGKLPDKARSVLVFTKAIDLQLLALISSITRIQGLQFVAEDSQAIAPFLEIKNRKNEIISRLSWQAPLDGRNLLKILLPAITIALLVIAWFTKMSLQNELSLRKEAADALDQANKELEQKVEARTKQLQNINSSLEREISLRLAIEKEILLVSDREQRKFGHDIHDGLCQQLTGILCHCSIAEKKLQAQKPLELKALREISNLLKDSLETAYNLSRGLSPLSLEPESLATSLQELAAKTEKLFGTSCSFECGQNALVTDPISALQLYKISQEAMNNAAKHAKASKIIVRLIREENEVKVSVEDNGIGFTEPTGKQKSMGLQIMKYRADIINGTFNIETSEGGGTTVSCSLPVDIS